MILIKRTEGGVQEKIEFDLKRFIYTEMRPNRVTTVIQNYSYDNTNRRECIEEYRRRGFLTLQECQNDR